MADQMWYAVTPDPTLPAHFWIARELYEGHDPNEQILCVKMRAGKLEKDFFINVTTIAADVSCPRCLEWLHA